MSEKNPYLVPLYQRRSVSFTHGQGVWLWDTAGKQYLDALSGIGVCNLGHAHPVIADTLCQQSKKLLHVSNGFCIPEQEQLAAKLCQLSGMKQAFFCNSGAESNEAAIKLTRLFARRKNIANPQVITVQHGFHGRSLATLSASGSLKIQQGFEPLVPGFLKVPFNDLSAIEALASQHTDIVAIYVEPVLGNGGVIPAAAGYLAGLRALCDAHDWLMVLDEVQSGVGRTGSFYAYQQADILPDVVCSAKGLGNGIPIGTTLIRDKALDLFKVNSHGSTFGGNPLACAVGLAVVQVMIEQQIPAHAGRIGQYLLETLQTKLGHHKVVKEIRGLGMMIGVELTQNCQQLTEIGVAEGILFNVTAETVIRLLPPLIMTTAEADELVIRLTRCIDALC